MIVLIDTATPVAQVSLAENGKILSSRESRDQKEHASFLQPALREMMIETETSWKQMEAVAVSNGPGSYTGLRVGLASAKGICYAHRIPLICLSTLDLMAGAYLEEMKHEENRTFVVAPMIDARRMEVYTAVYDAAMNRLFAPGALILTADSYLDYLEKGKVHFIGDGSQKWRQTCKHPNAYIPTNTQKNANYMAKAAKIAMEAGDFNDLAYAEPFYIKEFHSNAPRIGNNSLKS